ncbi:MAG: hypothetical protein JO258_09000 [Alphaproteobacteria bacterium]|nr:hypothetical protein [Alphaproteobacteria bacterium]
MSRAFGAWLGVGLGLVMLIAAPAYAQTAPAQQPPAQQPAAPPPPPAAADQAQAPEARVDGFRSAKWGMSEAQVKEAIHKDFNLAPDKVKSEENLAERTTVLSVTVPDLLENTGPARVSYILGFASKKLIQINVLWGSAVDPQASPERIVAAANELRQLFVDSGYQPATVVTNTKLPDGSVLVFKGQDADKHTTLLRLAAAAVTPAPPKGEQPKAVDTAALSLSYIADPVNPDIYRIKKGSF